MPDLLTRAGRVAKLAATDETMALINAQSLRELAAEEVFLFRAIACDTRVDRDFERFDVSAREKMAELYAGKPIIVDHAWSATKQTARIYAAAVEHKGEEEPGDAALVVYAYMLRNEEAAPVIAAIEGGIMREVSVGCRATVRTCSICGTDTRQTTCKHRRGETYDGTLCVGILSEITDVYELSFVAVPAQPAAGVVKRYAGEEPTPEPGEPEEDTLQSAQAVVDLERLRFE